MKATLRFLRVSPRKTRLVADIVRGKSVQEAVYSLMVTRRAASEPLRKLIESAAANAVNAATEKNEDLTADDLKIAEIYVNEGPTLKRFRPRAQGRATRINKRTSHVTCVLAKR
jgi:large subunit ribosomal protein L22